MTPTTTTPNPELRTSIFVHEHTHVLMCFVEQQQQQQQQQQQTKRGNKQRELFSMSSPPSTPSSFAAGPSSKSSSSSSSSFSSCAAAAAAAARFASAKDATALFHELAQQQQQQQPQFHSSGVLHLPIPNRPAVMTNANENSNNKIGMLMSTFMPLFQRVKGFLVNLVYAQSPADNNTAYGNSDIDADFYDADFNCNVVGGLGIVPGSIVGSLLFGDANPQRSPAAHGASYLQSSLLELIAMEAPQCMAAPATLAHGIGAAVDLYLSGLAKPTLPQTQAIVPQLKPQSKSPAQENNKLTLKKQQKRKHYLRQSANLPLHQPCKIVWPMPNGPHFANRLNPPATTTMHTLTTTLNVKPVHKTSNKNRREKERHELTRHIHDDLYDEAHRLWATAEEDAADVSARVSGDEDTVDCCALPSRSSGNIAVPECSQLSFAYFSCEDFPEMRPTSMAATNATAAAVIVSAGPMEPVVNVCAAAAADCTAAAAAADILVTVTASATPASTYKPSVSWEIAADELRTPSKKPSRLEQAKLRAIAAAAAAAAANAIADDSSNAKDNDDEHKSAASSAAGRQQGAQMQTAYQQLLLSVRPRRERQISECSDDYIIFKTDGSEAGDEINYDSSEFDDTDDEDSDDYTDGDTDDDDDDDDDEDHHNQDAVDAEDGSDSESECESATQQPDSGFEEKKVNKVRFAVVQRVHYIRAWSFAYRQARRSSWEQVGRDRVRFADRIRRLQDTLNPVLSAQHRERVMQRRIEQTAKCTEKLM